MCVLISDVSDKEGPGSADLPKVMACRWSSIYLEMPAFFFYQGRLVSEQNLDAWKCVCVYIYTRMCVCVCALVCGSQRLMASVFADHFPFIY